MSTQSNLRGQHTLNYVTPPPAPSRLEWVVVFLYFRRGILGPGLRHRNLASILAPRFRSPGKRRIVPGITRFSSTKFSVNTPPFLFWPLHWFPLEVDRIGAQGKGTTENCCRIWRWPAKRLSKEDQLAATAAFPHEWFRAWPPAPQNPELEQLTWNGFRHTRTHTTNQN